MQARARYRDIVRDVVDELARQIDSADAAGVSPRALVLDPGIGFAKRASHNWKLLAQFDVIKGMGYPVLIGASRKEFLGEILQEDGQPRAIQARDDATIAVSALVCAAGAWGIRVHEVPGNVDASLVGRAMIAARAGEHSLVRRQDGSEVAEVDHQTRLIWPCE